MAVKGLNVTIKDNVLTLTMPVQKPTPSASGKTHVVASSRGNVETEAEVNGRSVYVGFNAYIYPTDK